MNLLYLSPWFPFPPTNGSELRINTLLRGLATEHDVTLISFQRRPVEAGALEEARALLSAVRRVTWQEFDPRSARARLGFLNTKPRSVVDKMSEEMAGCMGEVLRSTQFDAIIASELDMAAYWPYFNNVPALLDDLELGIYRQQVSDDFPAAQRARRQLMWLKQRAYIRGLLPHFVACTVVSEVERALLRQVVPDYDAVELVPNCISVADYAGVRPEKEPATLIFTGSFTYGVNHEAMVWFLEEVWPLVRGQLPAARLIITGDHAEKPLPATDNVTLTGFIDDVKTAVATASISVAPIRQGGGTRLKILEAMALGTPVVSTMKGVEGLAAIDGEHLLLGDTPDAFATAVIRLLMDPVLRQKLADNAYQLMLAQYDWDVVMPGFLDLVERMATRSRFARHFHASL